MRITNTVQNGFVTLIAVSAALALSAKAQALSCMPGVETRIQMQPSTDGDSQVLIAESAALLRDDLLKRLHRRNIVFVGKVIQLSEPVPMEWHHAQWATFEVTEALSNVPSKHIRVLLNKGFALGQTLFVLAGAESESARAERLRWAEIVASAPAEKGALPLLVADGVCSGDSAFDLVNALNQQRMKIFKALPPPGSGGALKLTLQHIKPEGISGAGRSEVPTLELIGTGTKHNVPLTRSEASAESFQSRLEGLRAGSYVLQVPEIAGYNVECWHYSIEDGNCQNIQIKDRALTEVRVSYSPSAIVQFELIKADGEQARAKFSLALEAVASRNPQKVELNQWASEQRIVPGIYTVTYIRDEFDLEANGKLRLRTQLRQVLPLADDPKRTRIELIAGKQIVRLRMPAEYRERKIQIRNLSAGSVNVRLQTAPSSSEICCGQTDIYPQHSGEFESFTAAEHQWFKVSLNDYQKRREIKRLVRGTESKDIVLSFD
jgi:hypothetical protein